MAVGTAPDEKLPDVLRGKGCLHRRSGDELRFQGRLPFEKHVSGNVRRVFLTDRAWVGSLVDHTRYLQPMIAHTCAPLLINIYRKPLQLRFALLDLLQTFLTASGHEHGNQDLRD